MNDRIGTGDALAAGMTAGALSGDAVRTSGMFAVECHDADGNTLWSENVPNLLTTLGKNFLLDQGLAGSSYTAADYMGLISSASFSAVSASDTMASHSGWLEADSSNAPAYGTTRPTCAWSSASAGAKALSAALSFVFTNSGTVQGLFLVVGSGASATVANTGGTLFNAGTLATAQPVVSGNTITASYTATLT